jgi:tetratricopeptide (TPR) repeat protein
MAGRDEVAILHYRAAIDRDPRFGRAYSGLAVSAYKVGRSAEAEEAYKKAFSLLDRMTEREKLRTLGGYYLQFTKSYDKAVDNYGELVKRYPADSSGHGMLAYAYFGTLNFTKAWDEGREAMRLAPHSQIVKSNNALYAMYAGDFGAGMNLANQVVAADPKYFKAYLPLAIGALDAGNVIAAKQAYLDMSAATPTGRSLAETGLADIDLYLGRHPDAERRLRDALRDDRQGRRTQGTIAKQTALADALLQQGRTAQAKAEALAAVTLGQVVASRRRRRRAQDRWRTGRRPAAAEPGVRENHRGGSRTRPPPAERGGGCADCGAQVRRRVAGPVRPRRGVRHSEQFYGSRLGARTGEQASRRGDGDVPRRLADRS